MTTNTATQHTPWPMTLHTDGVLMCADGLSLNSRKRAYGVNQYLKRQVVRACNSHDTLLAACEAALARVRHMSWGEVKQLSNAIAMSKKHEADTEHAPYAEALTGRPDIDAIILQSCHQYNKLKADRAALLAACEAVSPWVPDPHFSVLRRAIAEAKGGDEPVLDEEGRHICARKAKPPGVCEYCRTANAKRGAE
jgi:hypothetical protein